MKVQTFEDTNIFSDTVTLRVIQVLPDGTYLCHKHTDCCREYADRHPDRYLVVADPAKYSEDNDPNDPRGV